VVDVEDAHELAVNREKDAKIPTQQLANLEIKYRVLGGQRAAPRGIGKWGRVLHSA